MTARSPDVQQGVPCVEGTSSPAASALGVVAQALGWFGAAFKKTQPVSGVVLGLFGIPPVFFFLGGGVEGGFQESQKESQNFGGSSKQRHTHRSNCLQLVGVTPMLGMASRMPRRRLPGSLRAAGEAPLAGNASMPAQKRRAENSPSTSTALTGNMQHILLPHAMSRSSTSLEEKHWGLQLLNDSIDGWEQIHSNKWHINFFSELFCRRRYHQRGPLGRSRVNLRVTEIW